MTLGIWEDENGRAILEALIEVINDSWGRETTVFVARGAHMTGFKDGIFAREMERPNMYGGFHSCFDSSVQCHTTSELMDVMYRNCSVSRTVVIVFSVAVLETLVCLRTVRTK